MEDYFEELDCELIKTISNGEESVYIYQDENGDAHSSDGNFFGNINDDYFCDALEEFECGWREIHWNSSCCVDWHDCEDEINDWYY